MKQVTVSSPLCRLLLALAACTSACASARVNESRATASAVRCSASETAPLAKLSGCAVVTGNVRVEHWSNADLGVLSALRSISGTLFIGNNPGLTSLDGLESLTSVDTVQIVNNPALEDVSALSGLDTARRLDITGNPRLDVISGANRLSHLDELVVENNGLTRLSGFDGLRTAREITIEHNPRMIYLSGLGQLRLVEHLSVRDNPRLAPTAGLFHSLQDVDVGELAARGSVVIERGECEAAAETTLASTLAASDTSGVLTRNAR